MVTFYLFCGCTIIAIVALKVITSVSTENGKLSEKNDNLEAVNVIQEKINNVNTDNISDADVDELL